MIEKEGILFQHTRIFKGYVSDLDSMFHST